MADRPRAPSPRQRGFSLLEAMVAMVILASAGWALFSWVNASIVSLRRVEDANARSAATSNSLEFLQTVNPMQRPEGRMNLGEYWIEWRATAITAVMSGSDYPRGQSAFDLALYETVVRVHRGEAEFWFDFRIKQVGYKKVRLSINPFQS